VLDDRNHVRPKNRIAGMMHFHDHRHITRENITDAREAAMARTDLVQDSYFERSHVEENPRAPRYAKRSGTVLPFENDLVAPKVWRFGTPTKRFANICATNFDLFRHHSTDSRECRRYHTRR
jgi:hypothetical protein